MGTVYRETYTKALLDGAEKSLRLDIADKLAAHFRIDVRQRGGGA